MNAIGSWNPQKYNANHNESIVSIPLDFLAIHLGGKTNVSRMVYMYPPIPNTETQNKKEQYYPMNSSYLKLEDNTHILNTRFVNYQIVKENGNYVFDAEINPTYLVKTKNLCTLLDDNYEPIHHSWLEDPPIKQINKAVIERFQGIEDIRLYQDHENTVKFIASSLNYCTNNVISIAIGTYTTKDMNPCDLQNTFHVHSPDGKGVRIEKNWCPILLNDKPTQFIYNWFPMEIGEIHTCEDDINCHVNKLVITQTFHDVPPFFSEFRGSTPFREYEDYPGVLLGLTHVSEQNQPRHYFHILVMLDKKTLHPVYFSQPFYFENIGVEFCTGFTIHKQRFHFWISQFDGNALKIECNLFI